MKTERKTVAPEQLLETYRQLLWEENAGPLPLVVTGNSMSPFLIHGRDRVWLARPDRLIHRGDILLYRRENGMYVLHRVYAVEAGVFTMVGDAQTELERGIQTAQVIAVVTQVERKGKMLTQGCFWWDFFERAWVWILPLRRPIHRLYSLLRGHHVHAERNAGKGRKNVE